MYEIYLKKDGKEIFISFCKNDLEVKKKVEELKKITNSEILIYKVIGFGD